jgi:UDP-glucose 4-epimerase
MARVGVTGASGFIGGALVPLLAGIGYDLRLIDNRSGPIEVTHPAWPVDRGDFEATGGLSLLADCDVILHLAAVSGVMRCAEDPEGSARTNVRGTARLVAMCRERRIPLAFASSFAVVGAPQELPVRESTAARPTHEYARQKAAGEELVAALGREGIVPTAIARQSNVYGGYSANGRYVAKGNVMQLFAQQARRGRLTVNAPGTQRRDFIHISDVLAHWEAIARFLLRPESRRESTTFNVASGEALDVLEVADRVARCFHRLHPEEPPLRIDIVPNPRGGVELVEPEFAVSRDETERLLGLRCRETVDSALPAILEHAEVPRGSS